MKILFDTISLKKNGDNLLKRIIFKKKDDRKIIMKVSVKRKVPFRYNERHKLVFLYAIFFFHYIQR